LVNSFFSFSLSLFIIHYFFFPLTRIVYPTITSLISKQYPIEDQGTVLGALNAIQTLGNEFFFFLKKEKTTKSFTQFSQQQQQQ